MIGGSTGGSADALGKALGSALALSLGRADGSTDGLAIGDPEGPADALSLGRAEGWVDGLSLGAAEGSTEPLSLGSADGSVEALSLGRADGSTDALSLGKAEGSGTLTPSAPGWGSCRTRCRLWTDDGDIQPAVRDRRRRCSLFGRDQRVDVQARFAGVGARRERERGLPPVLRDVGERGRRPHPVITIDELVGLTLLDVVARIRRDHDPGGRRP